MSYVIADRVQETTTTTGTGTVTMGGAVAQFQSFSSGVGSGNTCDYCLLSGNGVDWETGTGTVTVSGGTTLSRDTIDASSNAGMAISLIGTSSVFCTITAKKITAADFDDQTTGITAAGSNQSGATAMTKRENYVSTSIDGTHGVRIDAALMIPGNHIYVTNEHATLSLPIYPDTGVTINSQSVNVAISCGPDSTMLFKVKSATALRSVP